MLPSHPDVPGPNGPEFEKFAEENLPGLQRYVYQHYLREQADAEDVALEALEALWKYGSRFNPAVPGAKSWLYRIADNMAQKVLRYRSRHDTFRLDLVDEETPGEHDPVADYESAVMREAIREAVDALPEREQWCVMGVLERNERLSDLMEAFGLTKAQVRHALRLGMRRLQRRLRRYRRGGPGSAGLAPAA